MRFCVVNREECAQLHRRSGGSFCGFRPPAPLLLAGSIRLHAHGFWVDDTAVIIATYGDGLEPGQQGQVDLSVDPPALVLDGCP